MVARRFPKKPGRMTAKKVPLNRSQKEYEGYKNYGQARSAQAHVANAIRKEKVSDKIAPRQEKPATKVGSYAGAIKRRLGASAAEKINGQTKANTGFNPQVKSIEREYSTDMKRAKPIGPPSTSAPNMPDKIKAAMAEGYKNFGQQHSAAIHKRNAARKLEKKA